jgi:hypothetical protein
MTNIDRKKGEMFDDVIGALDKDLSADKGSVVPFGDWPIEEKIILDGKQFSFKKHEYLIEPYHDYHSFQVEIKATQLGLTSKALLKAMYGCRYGNYRGILYLFPSRTDVTDLSKTRLTPLIDDNPDNIGKWIMDTDAANVKKIWNSFLYLRGMKSRIGVKCHDDKTEVLTKRGWLLFKDTLMSDEFATRSPSGVFMWQKPIDIYSYHYNGDMYLFKATGLDVCVTPNHRMLVADYQTQVEWFDIAENLKHRGHTAIVRTCQRWYGTYPDFITIDGRESFGMKRFITIKGNKFNSAWESFGRASDRKINLKDFVAFLGLYIAEGSCSGVATGERKFGRISISQEKTSKHFNEIKTLLNRINSKFKYSGHSFRAGDMGLADILFPIGNKYNKQLPQWVLDLSPKYLEILWEWALKGDGHVTKTGYRNYATVSPVLAGQLQELLQKCGRSASILQQKQRTSSLCGRLITPTTICYLVSERKSAMSIVPKPQLIKYSGNVFCASVPNGTLYTRRNGYAIWSGNSIPVDFEVFDELDEAPQNAVDMALERMAHSDSGDLLFLSNPTLPDYGIDRLFQTTDMQYFLLKCPACNEYTNLVDTFPDCLRTVRGKVIRACMKCGGELDPSKGQWVAKRPSITERRGRQYSQLYAQTKTTTPEAILHKFNITNNLTDFYNLKIGIAYVDAQNRLSAEEVLNCCGDSGMLSQAEDGCYMGVDQGSHLHVVIARRHPKRHGEVVYIDTLIGNNEADKTDDTGWRQLDELMRRFKIMRCVVDALPHTKNARSFSDRFPGRVFLCYYNEHQKGAYKWNEREMTVMANRTESLDASHREIIEQNIILPRQSDILRDFAFQMHNTAKRLEEDEETGSQRYVYLKLGEDHYRHAFNYCMMGLHDAPELLFPQLM